MNRFSVLTGIPMSTKGFVRELRIRWALEEMGLPYEEIKFSHPQIKEVEYLKKQPFGQVPYFESGDLCMFESNAILLHLALKHNKLLPMEEHERAKILTWMFAAESTIDPFFFYYFMLKNDPSAVESSKNLAIQKINDCLTVVSKELEDREFFGKYFSIADIVMSSVLKKAMINNFLQDFENLNQYLVRNENRPAFIHAIQGHNKLYEVSK